MYNIFYMFSIFFFISFRQTGVEVERIAERKAHTVCIRRIFFDFPRGENFATCSDDGKIRLWNAKDAAPKQTLHDNPEASKFFVFIGSGRLASCGRGPEICLWDIRVPVPKFRLKGHEGWIHDLAPTPDGKYLVSTGEDWTIRVWNMQTFRLHRLVKAIEQLENPFAQEGVKSLAISSDGSKVATCGGGDGSIRLWSLPDLNLIDVLGDRTDPGHVEVPGIEAGNTAMTFSADGRYLAFPGDKHKLLVWDLRERRLTSINCGAEESIHALTFSPKLNIVACADNRNIYIIDILTKITLVKLAGSEKSWYGLLFSPDGSLITTGSVNGDLRIWNVDDGRAVFRHNVNHGLVFSFAFSPKGDRFASGHSDGTMILWSIKRTMDQAENK